MRATIMLLTLSALLCVPLAAVAGEEPIETKPGDAPVDVCTEVHVRVMNAEENFEFDQFPDGRVVLKVDEEDAKTGRRVPKAYEAASMEEFRATYPGIAERYDLDRYLPRIERGVVRGEDFETAWQRWKDRFESQWFWDRDPKAGDRLRNRWQGFDTYELDRWFDDQVRLFDRFRSLPPPGERATEGPYFPGPPPRAELGIVYGPMDPSLARHLGLRENEGILVLQVRPDSRADRSDLRPYDVILKIDRQPVGPSGGFGEKIRERIGREFELEIIRHGVRQTVFVRAGS